MAYRLGVGGGGGVGRPFVRHREDWGGVRCFELVNSPNIAPAAWNFGNVSTESSEPRTSAMVVAWLRAQQAEVVHVHSQEGYPLDLIPAIRAAGIPVVVTLHNYWFVCPQVDLLYKERQVCLDYEGGRLCEDCLAIADVRRLRRAKAVGDTLEHMLGMYPADVVRKMVYGVKPLARALASGKFLRRFKPKSHTPDWLIDPELGLGFDPDASHGDQASRNGQAGSRHEQPGLIRHDFKLEEWEQPRDYERAAPDTNERMLDAAARTHHLTVLNDFGRRRHAGVEALKAASLVTAPSDYLRRVHVAMGVPDERTRWVKLGQPHFDQIHRIAKRSPFYTVRPWDPRSARPLRFCFMGTTRPNKGLEVLTRAIPLLDREVRQRCHITIHAAGLDWSFRKRLSMYPEVSVYGAYDLYQLIAKAAGGGEYDVGVLPHIWLENSPLVLLENLHAGKFLISSRLGGPADWIVEPSAAGNDAASLGNGLLFPGGDEEALAECLRKCITGEVQIPSAKEVHDVSLPGLQSYPGHVTEVERLYQSICDRRDVAVPIAQVRSPDALPVR